MDQRAERLAQGHGRLAEHGRLLHGLHLHREHVDALQEGGGLGRVEASGGREHAAGLERLPCQSGRVAATTTPPPRGPEAFDRGPDRPPLEAEQEPTHGGISPEPSDLPTYQHRGG